MAEGKGREKEYLQRNAADDISRVRLQFFFFFFFFSLTMFA